MGGRLNLVAMTALFAVTVAEGAEPGFDAAKCSFKGRKLYGRIQIVSAFPDVKIKVVTAFPDLKVKRVSAFPDSCGKWQIVQSFPDIRVKFVESFPDVTIEYVESFPGIP